MIQIFRTANSTYEIDTENKLIRRIYGKENATERQGKDGDWRKFLDVSPVVVGEQLLIIWDLNESQDVVMARSTLTSSIIEIGGSCSN